MTLKSVAVGLLSVGIAAGLGACTSFNNYGLSHDVGHTATYAMNDDFNRYLAAEYSRYTTFKEYQLGVPFSFFDYRDVHHFAGKGRAAAMGDHVEMEHPENWNVRAAQDRMALGFLRTRINDLFVAGAKTRYPHLAAQAQVMFDCNVERAERRYFAPRVEYCDMDILTRLVDLLDGRISKGTMAVEEISYSEVVPTPYTPLALPVDEPVAAAQAPADYTGEPQVRYIKTEVTRKVLEEIYFPFDSAEIRPAGTRVLDKLMDQVRNGTMQKIMVVGYADRVGSAEYNQKLSMRRATAVERALLQRGFPRELIVATGVGETNLPHPTADGVPSARNRVVKIELAVTEVEKKELVD